MQALLPEVRPLVVAAGEPAAAAGEFKVFHSAKLRSLLHRLKRNELDMRSRLPKRVEALSGPGAAISPDAGPVAGLRRARQRRAVGERVAQAGDAGHACMRRR